MPGCNGLRKEKCPLGISAGLRRSRGTEQWIAAIRGTDGNFATVIDGICRSLVDFFSTLFSADELDLKVQEDLLENLSVRLPSSSSAL